MKIILSRKGFDSSSGGIPSPILPCGRPLSLPIPVSQQQMANGEVGVPYSDLRFDGQPISEIIEQLHNGQFQHEQAHLDPDLERERLENRREDWRRAFGQVGQAQTLLKNVRAGDLFLFFGWFRGTTCDGTLRYLRPRDGGKDIHVIFGWLQIDKILKVGTDEIPNCLEDHLHMRNAKVRGYGPTNTIYTAGDELTVLGQCLGVRGAGTFPCFKSSLQLTVPGRPRSRWCLPRWFEPQRPNHGKWECCNDYVPFDSQKYGRCQEFVFNVPDCQVTIDWIKSLFDGG